KPPRVGYQGDVESFGDLRGQLDTELAKDVREHLAGRRRVLDDQVDVPEARIVVLGGEVPRARHGVDQARLGTDPRGARAVERDQDALRDVRRTLPPKIAVRKLAEALLARA